MRTVDSKYGMLTLEPFKNDLGEVIGIQVGFVLNGAVCHGVMLYDNASGEAEAHVLEDIKEAGADYFEAFIDAVYGEEVAV